MTPARGAGLVWFSKQDPMHASMPLTPPWRIAFDRESQFKATVVAAGFVAFFWVTLSSLFQTWISDPDWSHGVIIPFFSAYLVSQRWDQIRNTPVVGAWLGLPLLLFSLVGYAFFLTPVGLSFGNFRPYVMLLALGSIVILLCGVRSLKYGWVPLAYLLFAIPIPKGIYYILTDPLRRIAAKAATAVLSAVPSLQVERVGSMVEYNYLGKIGTIGVADACSGMRSTITLCALGVAVAYITDRTWWQRLILILACIPIATFCNIVRVVITCFLHIFVHPKYAEGTYHMGLGLAVLLLAFGIFSGLGWILSNLVVEADEDGEASAAAGGGA